MIILSNKKRKNFNFLPFFYASLFNYITCSSLTVTRCSFALINVSCLHFGQYSGRFFNSVSFIAESDGPYERIMIKFSPQFVKPFIKEAGQHAFHQLYETYVYHFTEDVQNKIKGMFFDMLEEYEKNTPHRDFILQGMLFRLFFTIMEEHIPTAKPYKNPCPLTPQIMEAIIYMEEHYKTQPPMEEVAQHVGFSAGYFSRLFHSQLGITYSAYLNNIQLRHVQNLLTGTNMSIMEIAHETGYCHGDYLSAQFKKKVGMTPSQFRKQPSFNNFI